MSLPLSCSVCTQRVASIIGRLEKISAAIANSFTAFAFAPGVLNTAMPRDVKSATGMLFVPAPARATALTLLLIFILCISAERTIIASGFGISEAISYSSRGSKSKPLADILLSVCILYIKFSIFCVFRVRDFTRLCVLLSKVFHKRHQFFYTLNVHSVVQRCSHAAD